VGFSFGDIVATLVGKEVGLLVVGCSFRVVVGALVVGKEVAPSVGCLVGLLVGTLVGEAVRPLFVGCSFEDIVGKIPLFSKFSFKNGSAVGGSFTPITVMVMMVNS